MHVLTNEESVRAAAAIRLALAVTAGVEELAARLGEEMPAVLMISGEERHALAELADRLTPRVMTP